MAAGGNPNAPSADGSNRNTDPSKNGPFTQSEIDLLKYSFGADTQKNKPSDEVVNKGNLSRLQSKLEDISFEKNQKFFHKEPSKFTKTEILKFTATYLGMNLSESNDVETLLASEEFETFYFYKTLAAEAHNQNPNLRVSDYHFGQEDRDKIKEYLFRITAPYLVGGSIEEEGAYRFNRRQLLSKYARPVIEYLLEDPDIPSESWAVAKAPEILPFLLEVDPLQLLRSDWKRKPSTFQEYIAETFSRQVKIQKVSDTRIVSIPVESVSLPDDDEEGFIY